MRTRAPVPDEFNAAETALLRLFGWGRAPSREQTEQIRYTAEQLAGLAECYGDNYAPTPERIARFPAYTQASGFSRWGPTAVVNHWKRAVDFFEEQDAGTRTTAKPKPTTDRNADRLKGRDYAAADRLQAQRRRGDEGD